MKSNFSHAIALVASVAATLGAVAVASPAVAAAKIDGDAKSISIRLENSSLDEALKSLGGAFDLRYRAPGSLNKPLSGTYRGPLKDVVKNLLSGYDFVLTTRGSTIDVSVLGKSTKSAADVIGERNQSAAAKPAMTAQRPAAPSAGAQDVVSDSKRENTPAPAPIDETVPRPMLVAQNDPSKMPMPMPGKMEGPMPMPTPQTDGDGPVPRPDTSGSASMPMPMPQADANGPVPILVPPAANAQPVSLPNPTASSDPAPKPN